MAKSAAGAALESDVHKEELRTFTPGEGQTAAESFQTAFTLEQKEQLRAMVANAKSPQEIEVIEASVQKGIFPSHLFPKMEVVQSNGTDEASKRSLEESNEGSAAKKART